MGLYGIGMPAVLLLEQFGEMVRAAFDATPYQVGSSVAMPLPGDTGERRAWRDVDVRVILSDEDYAALGFGDPAHPHSNEKWVALVLAFSALGRQMTGLPIDFQIQQRTRANAEFTGVRSALGMRREIGRLLAQRQELRADSGH